MAMEGFDLGGRVAIVTGGGTGIGRATALLLAERGAAVAVAGRRREPLDSAVDEIEAAGGKALAIEADVRKPESAQAMVEAVMAGLGRIDILINNAGGAHGHVPLAKMDLAKWDRDIQLNLSAAMYCSQAALPYLKASKGCVVNISSLAGMHGTQGVGAYSAAKAGLQMFTRVCAAEWGPAGVRVNCVAPGMIATELAMRNWEKTGFDAMGASRGFPLRRPGEPREVAQMVVFFASDASSYITGESVSVGGGPQIGGMIRVEE
jgi:NAD(P)-dependent dehydrogenase (short-subunit alcohol dehydrogenase family)